MNTAGPARDRQGDPRGWLRTGLALFAVGLLITWTSLWSSATASGDPLVPWLGIIVAALGVVSSTGAMIATRWSWMRGRAGSPATSGMALVLASLAAMLGAALALILLAEAC